MLVDDTKKKVRLGLIELILLYSSEFETRHWSCLLRLGPRGPDNLNIYARIEQGYYVSMSKSSFDREIERYIFEYTAIQTVDRLPRFFIDG